LNHRVQIFDDQLTYLATIGETGVPGADNAHFNNPKDVAVDSRGTIYISDDGNFRVQVFDSSRNYLRTIGTTGEMGDDFDHFNVNYHLAVDAADNLYVSDSWNNRVQVFDSTGAYLTTIAGSWGMLSGQIYGAAGIAIDGAGAVFVGDSSYRIQKFAPGYPGWRQANINGFGDRQNTQPMRLAVHNGYLYASTSNYTNGTEVWRAGVDHVWTQVSLNGFGVISNTQSFVQKPIDGYLYVGTTNEAEGAELWRCAVCDGTDWSMIAEGGFNDKNNVILQQVLVFSNTLYAELDNHTTGVEIWSSITGDAGSWTQTNQDGFGNPLNSGGWAAELYNGYLYIATCQTDETSWMPGGFLGTEVWRTNNGAAWEEVTPTDITGNSNAGWDLEAMNDQLYFSTGSEAGTQIRQCTLCDGSDWELLTEADFGSRAFGSVLFGYRDNLYAVNSNNWMLGQLGLEVWVSTDGSVWTRIASDGFGKLDNTGIGAEMIVKLNGNLFVGAQNYTNGGEVWQLLLHTNFLPLITH
jgi:hypothetical protein